MDMRQKMNALADHWERHGTEGFQCVEELRDLSQEPVCTCGTDEMPPEGGIRLDVVCDKHDAPYVRSRHLTDHD